MIHIAAATSISKENNYDEQDTLQYCKEKQIPVIQLFLNEALLGDDEKIPLIRENARRHNIALTCHAPVPLNAEIDAPHYIEALQQVLDYQAQKKVIIHFDEHLSTEAALTHIKALNQHGLTVCLENFYQRTDARHVMQNVKRFVEIFDESRTAGLDIIPVFDLPRLFIAPIKEALNPQELTNTILQAIARSHYSLILHAIDFTDYSQKRETWCPIGKGLTPYREIFTRIAELQIPIDHIVLEFEDKAMFSDSLPFFRQM